MLATRLNYASYALATGFDSSKAITINPFVSANDIGNVALGYSNKTGDLIVTRQGNKLLCGLVNIDTQTALALLAPSRLTLEETALGIAMVNFPNADELVAWLISLNQAA